MRPPLQLLFLIRHPYQRRTHTLGRWLVVDPVLACALCQSAGTTRISILLGRTCSVPSHPGLGPRTHAICLSCPRPGVIILASHRTSLLSAAPRLAAWPPWVARPQERWEGQPHGTGAQMSVETSAGTPGGGGGGWELAPGWLGAGPWELGRETPVRPGAPPDWCPGWLSPTGPQSRYPGAVGGSLALGGHKLEGLEEAAVLRGGLCVLRRWSGPS